MNDFAVDITNPTFLWDEGYTYNQQVGENLVDAALPTGASITTPFTAYSFPKAPHHKSTEGGR